MCVLTSLSVTAKPYSIALARSLYTVSEALSGREGIINVSQVYVEGSSAAFARAARGFRDEP